MKLNARDAAVLICIVAIAFLSGIIADKLSSNYWIGYFTMVGTLILIPNLIALGKVLIPKRTA